MRNADAWIFTSVNAVAHAQRLDAGVWPRTIAVGAATAAALRRLDHAVELPAERLHRVRRCRHSHGPRQGPGRAPPGGIASARRDGGSQTSGEWGKRV